MWKLHLDFVKHCCLGFDIGIITLCIWGSKWTQKGHLGNWGMVKQWDYQDNLEFSLTLFKSTVKIAGQIFICLKMNQRGYARWLSAKHLTCLSLLIWLGATKGLYKQMQQSIIFINNSWEFCVGNFGDLLTAVIKKTQQPPSPPALIYSFHLQVEESVM